VAIKKNTWVEDGNQPADDYTFFCGNGNHYFRGRSAVKRVEFITDRMSCTILRGL
jgi:hypothetical protein